MLEAGPAPEAAATAGGRTGAIVVGALVRIREDLVRLGDLLELGLGIGRGIPVRMEFHRLLAVGLLDLIVGGTARDAQHFVQIAHCKSPSTSRPVCSTRPMILS